MIELKFTQCDNLKETGTFGPTNYMLRYERRTNGGWLYANLLPRGEVGLLPEATRLGVCADETVRISMAEDGRLYAFRLSDYLDRLNDTAKAIGIEQIEKDLVSHGISELVNLEKQYIGGGVFYARIVLMSRESDPSVFPVKDAYLTVTLESAPMPTLSEGISVCTSENCTLSRPDKIGTPFACAVRRGLIEARRLGFDNVLWLDSTYKRYIDSLAGMDVFFHIGDKVICVGDGITADSCRILMRQWGVDVKDERMSTDRLLQEYQNANVTEVFAVGTENYTVPVKSITIGDTQITFSRTKLAKKLFDTLVSQERKQLADTSGWIQAL